MFQTVPTPAERRAKTQRTRADVSPQLRQVEAIRHEAGIEGVHAEEGLSVNDWIDRVKGAVREAQTAARAGEDSLQQEAWLEMAAIATGRAQQLAWAAVTAACTHDFPEPVMPSSRCTSCDVLMGEVPNV